MTEIAPEQAVAPDLSHTPVRDFTLRSAFALAFSDVSPIVGIYSVFGLCLVVAGPAFFSGFPLGPICPPPGPADFPEPVSSLASPRSASALRGQPFIAPAA